MLRTKRVLGSSFNVDVDYRIFGFRGKLSWLRSDVLLAAGKVRGDILYDGFYDLGLHRCIQRQFQFCVQKTTKRHMCYSQQRIAQQIERKGTTKFWHG